MSHANARLTFHGRFLLVERVIGDRRPVAHVAKELGVSRQCAHRWVKRFRAEAEAGLLDRSSRPHRTPSKTSTEREDAVIAARTEFRCGPARLSRATGVPERTISRILARRGLPPLAACDPVTGAVIRATRSTAVRYERQYPGELIHVDVKKLGRIPDGGGWRAHGRSEKVRGRGIGFDYIHAAIDDHSRLAYAEIHPDEKGPTAAAFLLRAAAYFKAQGIRTIERIITDNAFAYRKSAAFKAAAAQLGAEQRFIKPHCPWTNGKIERFNRTLATEWAYAKPFTSNTERAKALDPWLNYYNTERIHAAIKGTPIMRVSLT
ncbi:IS481 family transposase [Arthrobacter sp. NPDC093128]|uniref:IS481 family transposase n=1 Tax=Arthrobacter sp. NPDC093128 TaxID=3154979 RepID=UPI00344B0035